MSTGGKYGKLIDQARFSSELLKALAHELRLLTLCHIGEGERTVQELEAFLGTTQSNLSQHLAKLRHSGVLDTRKEGNLVYYRIRDRRALRLIGAMQNIICRSPRGRG